MLRTICILNKGIYFQIGKSRFMLSFHNCNEPIDERHKKLKAKTLAAFG